MSTNVFVIFDTCDVMHNWFFSLLPPIVLNNLFVLQLKFNKSELALKIIQSVNPLELNSLR